MLSGSDPGFVRKEYILVIILVIIYISGGFVPELINTKKSDPYEEYFKKIHTDEFFHSFERGGVAISLRIPIKEVKDIGFAIAKAKDAGFDARIDAARDYLEIAKYGYRKEDDQKVVEELKKLAKEISKEDYLEHIEKLNFQTNQKSSNANNQNELVENAFDELEALCSVLNIPIVSSVEELKKLNSNSTVIFASKHDNSDTEPYMIKEILNQKLNGSTNNGKKVILGFEFYSDKYFVNLLNDPKRNLNDATFNEILALMPFRETIIRLVKVFNEIQQKYSRDKFEIKPFDVTYPESVEKLSYLVKGDEEKAEECDKRRNSQVVKNILDLLKAYGNNLVVYTGTFHVIDLLTELKEIIKSGNADGIKIDNIVVVALK